MTAYTPDRCTYDHCRRFQWAGSPWCQDHLYLMRSLRAQARAEQAQAEWEQAQNQ